ncbi:hypothetical protein SAMN04488003_109103 [Loktanella fryxellensis]|uniref:Capsule polysaccharide biosynthesis protein n=1 Tax=Loktanella fryxellensis TaxID=245187 RepID=A0A1H8DYD8_9RHOB|nr:hypothetical protein [Loktanella fryxellensis]SEN12176.1 hypothetical protein SAMN04488003_109103 [Loktanella fryxellensis]
MDQPHHVTFYLDPSLLASARAGQHNFIGLVARTLTDAGLRVFFAENTEAARRGSAARPGYALFNMDDPAHPRALTMRRSYFYPFWQIAASAKRWEWDVALADFDPAAVDEAEAKRFANYWRKRLFPTASTAPNPDGPVYIPLQGRLRKHRSFQSASPVDMIAQTAARFAENDIVVTLHPKEDYDAADHRALQALTRAHANVAVVDRDMVDCLNACRLVVTENSSVAFAGYIFHRPAVLFAQVDFHHIAGNVSRFGADRAFADWQAPKPYDAYIWWFLQHMSINAGRPAEEVQAKIAGILRRHGWPV